MLHVANRYGQGHERRESRAVAWSVPTGCVFHANWNSPLEVISQPFAKSLVALNSTAGPRATLSAGKNLY